MNPAEFADIPDPAAGKIGIRRDIWAAVAFSTAILIGFYGMVPLFGSERAQSALGWLRSAWNGDNDFEHGLIFPFLIAGLIFHRQKELSAAVGKGSGWGLLAVAAGALCYVLAFRTLQPRIAVGGLPLMLWGAAGYLWGSRVARILSFPLFFFWLSIPIPSFQQATMQLQLVATSLAHHGAGWCGVATYTKGTEIFPVKGDWPPLTIAGGCSGIHSLMALLMISAAWAYVAKISVWKKALLFSAAVPLAILGNALRVTSIFVIAEYGNAKWARETWHDWSGLLLFYPFSLVLLLGLHSLLEGGVPWKRHLKHPSPAVPNDAALPPARFSRGSKFRAMLLPALLAATLGSICFLPQTGAVAQSAIKMTLPATAGAWQLQLTPPSEAEIGTLAKDTKFAKAICRCPRGEFAADADRADLSVVLSGHDLNNSIHRPERCMPAQGHNIIASKDVTLKLANGRVITVRRIRSIQTLPNPANRKLDRDLDCVTYYFFVGHDRLEHNHVHRTLTDMRDRILRGIDQRWAYVTLSMWFGKVPEIGERITEQEADAKLLSLLAKFAETQINWQQIAK
ncbi:MAG: exosortase/archaeosortase family protein [Verrucomicrobiota bacterium]